MYRLIAKDPRNQARILPFIGGGEVNNSPSHNHRRYVINFADLREEEAREWPDLMTIVEDKVKPERIKLGNNTDARRRKKYWWQWGRYTPALFDASAGLERILVCPGGTGATTYLSFCFLPNKMVYSQTLCVFALEGYAALGLLQSQVHDLWARFFCTTFGSNGAPRYNSANCFETFPFPENWQTVPTLEAEGQTYYKFRADLMVRNDEGLTKTYNRFHDPNTHEPDIVKLRELHAAMDRAVLDAYGWDDISTDCEFIADYEVEEGKKVPWRYRWPEAVHDEVLARLMDLNQKRHEEESNQSQSTKKKPAPKGAKKDDNQAELF